MRAAAQGWGSDRYTQIELEFNVGICCFTLSVAFFVNFSWGTGGGERQGGGGGGGTTPGEPVLLGDTASRSDSGGLCAGREG